MLNISKKTTHPTALIAISVLLVVALLAVMLPQQGASAVGLAVTCSTYHSVASGETLSSIALKYNVTVQELASANDLKEPYQIFVGQRLCIPGTTSATSNATTTATATGKGPDFTVKAVGAGYPFTYEVATFGYPKGSSYFVRIRSEDGVKTQFKVGTLKTNKNGVGKRIFRLPKQLRTETSVVLCLKNARTDDVQCNRFTP